MNIDAFVKAIELAEKLKHIFVATADGEGLPHLAVAGEMTCGPEGCVALRAWFCPGTVANLQDNSRISLVVWDAAGDEGVQLLGRVERVTEVGIMDGYDPQVEQAPPMPQVQRELIVHIDEALQFTHAPHSDVEA